MIARALLGAGGVALVVSLFLPWFDGVSGWEHWAWADVVLAVLAVALAAGAALPARARLRVPLAVLCGLGVAVVLGHGFEPRVPARTMQQVAAGPYLCLGALAAGAIGALWAWPRRGGVVLLVAAAAGLVASLFSGWGTEDGFLVLFGTLERLHVETPNGFERWRVLDVGLLVLATALLGAASGRAPALVRAALAVAALAAAVCVLVATHTTLWVGDGGAASGAPMGELAALVSLAAALAGLALIKPRERAARAG